MPKLYFPIVSAETEFPPNCGKPIFGWNWIFVGYKLNAITGLPERWPTLKLNCLRRGVYPRGSIARLIFRLHTTVLTSNTLYSSRFFPRIFSLLDLLRRSLNVRHGCVQHWKFQRGRVRKQSFWLHRHYQVRDLPCKEKESTSPFQWHHTNFTSANTLTSTNPAHIVLNMDYLILAKKSLIQLNLPTGCLSVIRLPRKSRRWRSCSTVNIPLLPLPKFSLYSVNGSLKVKQPRNLLCSIFLIKRFPCILLKRVSWWVAPTKEIL